MVALPTDIEIREFARTMDAELPHGWRDAVPSPWNHIGAIVADAGLQAGINYETVVLPRVRRIVHLYPAAATTRGFSATAQLIGLDTVLMWSHPTKLARVASITTLLLSHDVDTVRDLRSWLQQTGSLDALLGLHGVGRKTVDYLKKLAGLPAMPVDRHLRRFAHAMGLWCVTYDEWAHLYARAACVLGVDPSILDAAVWQYCRSNGHGR